MDYKNPLKMIDPVTGMEVTPQPPMPSNQMGMAKPVFNQTTQDVANQVYGTPLQRQMSMPQPPMFMTAKQEKAFGPGSEVYESGNTAIYEGLKAKDNSMASMSPLEFHGGPHGKTVLGQNYSLSAENYADSVRVAKREKRFNEMMKPKMTRTITNMPYTKEQLKARNESIKKSEAKEILKSKAKEILKSGAEEILKSGAEEILKSGAEELPRIRK